MNKIYNNATKRPLFTSLLFIIVILMGYALYQNTPSQKIKNALRTEFPSMFGRGSAIIGPLTIEEIEARETPRCAGCPQVPFGRSNESWEAFKMQVQEGDELYLFSSDKKSWSAFAGRLGYAHIRDGKVVDVMIILISWPFWRDHYGK